MRKFMISAAIIALIAGTSLAIAQDRDHRDSGNEGRGGAQQGERGGGPRADRPAPSRQAAPDPAMNGRNAIGQREMREHHDTPAAADTMRGINRAMDRNPGRQDSNRRDNNRSDFNGQNANRPDANNNDRRGNPGRQDRQDNNRQDNNRQDNNRSNFNGQNANRPDFNNNDRRDNRRNDNNRPGFDQRNSNGFGNDIRGDRRGGSRHDFSDFRNFHQNFRADRRFRAPSYRRPPGYYARRWSWGQVLPSFFWTQNYWLTDYYDYDLPSPPFGAIWVRVGDDALLIDRESGEIIEVDYGVFY